MAKIAILGYGTVGSGVYDVLTKNRDRVAASTGETVDIKYVLDLRDFPGQPVEKVLVHDYEKIVSDPEVSVVVEVMGGLKPSYDFVMRALEAGKSVCTSNKALVAEYGPELLRTAEKNRVLFLFEAAVGGGIPIIRPLRDCLTADRIDRIAGILNGTTNYILTRMAREGSSYQEVLKDAQRLGYAERDPSADVDGWDACRKIAILASIVTGKQVRYQEIPTEGIAQISEEDMRYAAEWKRKIKLIAEARFSDGAVSCHVAPAMLDDSSQLYYVDDVINGIYVHGDQVGDLLFTGAGAGKYPTASAVAGDVVECVKSAGFPRQNLVFDGRQELTPEDETETSAFLRIPQAALDEARKCLTVEKEIHGVVPGEVGVAVSAMRLGDLKEAAKKLSAVKMIRMA
ncbi:MAG: homoserine dehydrogenase [Lachnospiraceae bacterium]|jgi:homoserine dehydrogenase